MEKNLTALKTVLAAACTAVSAFLGWKGILALSWLAVMALDYISGTAAACKAGEWSSRRAREGLWHKCGMIFAVAVAGIADGVMVVIIGNIPALGVQWPGLAFPLVLTWYILTELGSILENAVKLGAVVPQPLVNMLKTSLKAVEGPEAEDQEEHK